MSKRQARTGENPDLILSEVPEARELETTGSGVEAEGSMFTSNCQGLLVNCGSKKEARASKTSIDDCLSEDAAATSGGTSHVC